ncbi:MAG: hypothetical protein LQ346_009016 [Caloplaca aetnensis]|nr:MAG: hypothetical protein LQ346_009016 [Caloplaca aetnensis]
MPFESGFRNAIDGGSQNRGTLPPRPTTDYDSQERLLQPEREDLKQARQKQLERDAREREREEQVQRRQFEKEAAKDDKERKREEQLYEREVREYDRAREQRGKAAGQGVHPFSELKHAISVSVRKRMPGTRW